MKITKHQTIQATADRVWQVFAHDFDQADEWMSSIPKTSGAQLGEQFEDATSCGRVCEIDANPNGIKIKEAFLAYDEQDKRCKLDISLHNAPFIAPIYGNQLTFSVRDTGVNQSEITWIMEPKIKPLAHIIYPLLKFGIGKLAAQILEELTYFIEQGQPHPSKVKAMAKFNATSKA